MDIIRLRALRGPNLWGRHTAIEATLHCPSCTRTSADLPDITKRIQARFPGLGALPVQGPSAQATPLPLPELVAIAALSLQISAGCPVTFYRCVATVEDGVYQIVVEYSEEAVGRLAVELAL